MIEELWRKVAPESIVIVPKLPWPVVVPLTASNGAVVLPSELSVTGPWVCNIPAPEIVPLLLIPPFLNTSVFGSDNLLPDAIKRLRTPLITVPPAGVTVVVLMMWIGRAHV